MYAKRLIREILKAIWNFLKKRRSIRIFPRLRAWIIKVVSCICVIWIISVPVVFQRGEIKDIWEDFWIEKIVIESVGTMVEAKSETAVQDTVNGMEEQQSSLEVAPSAVEDKICAVFGEDCELMIAIAKAESGLNPNAYHKNNNGSEDFGIFQINSIHGEDNLFDVDKNIEVAKKIYDTQGLNAWVVYKTGAYNKFLNS